MDKKYHHLLTASLVFATIFLVTATATVALSYGSSITLSNFSVTPVHAVRGQTVTGSVSVLNSGQSRVSVVVSFFDGGAKVTDNSASPTAIRGGETVIVQLTFNTVADPAHCYLAEATAAAPISPVGYCEAGSHVLGGASLPVSTTALASVIGVASVAIAAALMLTLLRRRTN